jgi:gliding motility-associated-like protein
VNTTFSIFSASKTQNLPIMRFIFLVAFLVSGHFITNAQCNGSEPVINFGPDTILCQGQTLALNAPPGFNFYQWSTGTTGPNITVTTDGSYYVNAGLIGNSIILNGNFQGGTTTAANNFTTAYGPGTGGTYGLLSTEGQYAISTSPSLVHTNFSFCGDHTTGTGNMLIANGASAANTTVWTQTVNVAANTDYVFSFWEMNVLNTTAVASLQLFINGAPISGIIPTSTTACVWLENAGVWNSGASTQAILSIVNQSTLTSGNDFAIDDIYFAPICLVTDTINVNYDTVQVNAGTDLLFCANETDTLTATANVDISAYSWSSGQQVASFSPTTGGTYTVTGTSLNGCTSTDQVNVSITPMDWNISQIIMGPSDCGQTNGYVSAVTSGTFSDPASYTWTGPGPNNPNAINASVWDNLSPGWYYLSIESNGCYRYDSMEVTINNPPVAAVSATPLTGIYPLSVVFTNTSQFGTTYDWNFGNGSTTTATDLSTQNTIYDTTGTYVVMLVATTGSCTDTAYVTIIVNDPPVIPPTVPVSLETANVFTPNGDGANDFYTFNMENITSINITILNRWGNVVYQSTDPLFKWDGKAQNGVDALPGVYFYTYTANGAQGEPFNGHGFIHLVR